MEDAELGNDAPTVDTPSGRLRGTRVVARDVAIGVWKGIPYAEPPIGDRRFAPPVPAEPWVGIRDAGSYGPIAVQAPSAIVVPGEEQSEDCLTLNVWAPEGGSDLPVMVWFHGGSFVSGSASTLWYDGARLASRGVIVVTVNYRLGPLGFLHLEPLGGEGFAGSATAGIADQGESLRWVRDHIGAFGGDRSNVTIFGESAGAMSVSTHLAYPSSAGLFRRAIAQSGAARHVHGYEDGEQIAAQVMEVLGVDRAHPERLRHLPASAFVEVQGLVRPPDGAELPLAFAPTVDGASLPIAPLLAIGAGSSAGVDLVVGSNLDEMNFFILLAQLSGQLGPIDDDRLRRHLGRAVDALGVARSPDDVIATYRRRLGDATPGEVWSAIATDLVFGVPAMALADAHRDHGSVRSYLYTHRSTGFDGALGSAHVMEIPFVFDNTGARGVRFLNGEIDDRRREFAGRLADAWVSFAATGDPSTPELGPWPEVGPARTTMVLDIASRPVDDPQGDERRIWYP